MDSKTRITKCLPKNFRLERKTKLSTTGSSNLDNFQIEAMGFNALKKYNKLENEFKAV